MRIALCFAGHMRTYEKTAPNWKEYLIDPLQPDVFISSWKRKGPWERTYGAPSPIDDKGTLCMDDIWIDQDHSNQTFQPKLAVYEDYFDLELTFQNIARPAIEWRDSLGDRYKPYKVTSYVSQYYKWYMSNELKKQYERENEFEYDVVIRTRPDLRITGPIPLENPQGIHTQISADPNNPSWVNDLLFFGKSKDMDTLASLYTQYPDHLERAIRDNTPELFFEVHTLVWNHLKHNGLAQIQTELPFGRSNQSLVR